MNYTKLFCYNIAEILKVLLDAFPELSMTVDPSNTTALHTAAAQGHIQVVKFLLEEGSSLLTIAKSNGKTALHSAARHGHLEVLRALLSNESGITTRIDKKGQTALHMAVKGMNFDLVDELVKSDPSLLSMTDNKGNTALHIATRKGRAQVRKLFSYVSNLQKVTAFFCFTIFSMSMISTYCALIPTGTSIRIKKFRVK